MPEKSAERARMGLDALLRETIDALAVLDADRIEEIAGLIELAVYAGPPWASGKDGPIEWPDSAAQWRRAAASHWVLGHLAGATARQLAVQRRIAGDGERFDEYRPERDARLASRLSSGLAWPWGKEPGRRS